MYTSLQKFDKTYKMCMSSFLLVALHDWGSEIGMTESQDQGICWGIWWGFFLNTEGIRLREKFSGSNME